MRHGRFSGFVKSLHFNIQNRPIVDFVTDVGQVWNFYVYDVYYRNPYYCCLMSFPLQEYTKIHVGFLSGFGAKPQAEASPRTH